MDVPAEWVSMEEIRCISPQRDPWRYGRARDREAQKPAGRRLNTVEPCFVADVTVTSDGFGCGQFAFRV